MTRRAHKRILYVYKQNALDSFHCNMNHMICTTTAVDIRRGRVVHGLPLLLLANAMVADIKLEIEKPKQRDRRCRRDEHIRLLVKTIIV